MIVVVGLVLHSVGIFLMLRYRLPDNLPRIGVVVRALSDKDLAEDERRKVIAMLGLVMFGAGVLLMALSFIRAGLF